MKRDVSTKKPDWQKNARVRFHEGMRFILTDWDLAMHNQKCRSLAGELGYNYTFDRELGFAFLTPRN
jgi:hypothetical protein